MAVEGVDVAMLGLLISNYPSVAPYVDNSIIDGGRGAHNVSGRVAPRLRPGCRIQGVDVMVIAPYVDDTVGDDRTRGSSSGRIVPHLCSSIRIEGIEVVVIGKGSCQARTEHGSKKYGCNK